MNHKTLLIVISVLTFACGPAQTESTTAVAAATVPVSKVAVSTEPTAESVNEPEVVELPTMEVEKETKVEPSQPKTAESSSNKPEPSVPSAPAAENTSVAKETSAPVEEVEPIPALPAQPDHSQWNTLLSQYVSNTGIVNYSGLRQKKAALQAYLDDLAANTPQSDWSAKAAKAYWINAYNAFTVKLILDNYPLNSIMDIDGGKPWDTKWIKLGGKTYSLNQIEHDILRPTYGDARIHFAVNCAAKSCPPIHNRAFTEANVNSTLSRLTRTFINNESYNSISEDAAVISKIFDWYGVDFGDLRTYLNKYSSATIAEGVTPTFKEYDWALNGQ